MVLVDQRKHNSA